MSCNEHGISRHIASMPGSDRFIALESIAGDLYEVQELINCCRSCGPEFGQETSVVVQACWSAAVIRYGRCFLHGDGRRIRAQDFLDRHASEPDRSFHDYLMALRHNMYAHDGGIEEDRRLVADMRDGELIGIRTAGATVASLGTDLADQVFAHVSRVAGWFNKEAEGARDELLRSIRFDPSSIQLSEPYVPLKFDLSPNSVKLNRLMAKERKVIRGKAARRR